MTSAHPRNWRLQTDGWSVPDTAGNPLPHVDYQREYNLDAAGNWVDDGFSGSDPAVLSKHDCHANHQSRTTNNLNQIHTVDGNSLSYDAKGNLLSDHSLSFAYDAFDRLATAIG
jgi:hypothetical protein